MINLINGDTDAQALAKLLDRALPTDGAALEAVEAILRDVRANGDEAVLRYTRKFDGAELSGMLVTPGEIEAAYAQVSPQLVKTMETCAVNIRAYHEKQKQNTWLDVQKGATLGQLIRPLKRVGVYVPGGRAAYPSSVLMNALPAKVAGVERLVMVSPPDKEGRLPPLTLIAAHQSGVDSIYKVGGAQAIAALAYGTETIPRVDKITGPGNLYVTLAKRQVFGLVGIDMTAGPSEVLIVADGGANAAHAAADLLAQAEHDPLSSAILVTTSQALAQAVERELEKQLERLERREIAAAALRDHGAIVLCSSLERAMDISNQIAPEHLEIMTGDPYALLGHVENAGAVFLGDSSPEPLGDYYAGPDHVLPTSGTARFFSPLSVDDFIKKTSVINYSPQRLEQAAQDIIAFAEAEGLTAHANSIKIRIASGKGML